MNQFKHTSLKRMLVNRVIAIAVISIVVTGGLALLLYLNNLTAFEDFSLRQQINNFIPGLFEIGILVIFALFLALGLIFLFLGKTLQSITDMEEKSSEEDIDDWYVRPDNHIDQEEKNESASYSEYKPEPSGLALAASESLKAELESERSLNNLMFSLLGTKEQDYERNISFVLESLGTYCKSDFAAIYTRDGETENYLKTGFWDAEPELARHSSKVDAINLPAYRWMHKTIQTGKPFIFRTAMLESMMASVQNAAEDVKDWMRMQAQESAEHKLARHEGWEHFICFPCLRADENLGLFLAGFHKADLPVSKEVIERLTSISAALAHKLYAKNEFSQTGDNSTDIQMLLNNIDDAVFTTDLDGNIVMLNTAAETLINSSNINQTGKDWNEVFSLVDSKTRMPIADPVCKIYREDVCNVSIRNAILFTPDGRELLVEGMAAPIQKRNNEITGVIFILRNITERQRLFNERCETEKMEAVSSLSSGFAHDFNNILTAILGNISLAMDDVTPESETAAFLKAAEESTLKGKAITDNLLIMAKSSPLTEVTTDAMKSLEPMVNNLVVKTDVKPVFMLPNKFPEIKMSLETFEKIITNIVNNSMQAMPQGGVLTVSARDVAVNSNSGLPLSPGKYVCIRIKDTGEGIAPENQNKVFVPYFTTRKSASGLGLTIAYSLLKKHNGYIRLQSLQGKGTECEIYIPLVEPSPVIQTEHKPAALRNTPLALVLDEDDALGNLLIKTMVKMGLRVQKTTDTEELSTLFFKAENNGSPVKLVVADLNLPAHNDISGLLQVFKKADPKVKLIAYSNRVELSELDEYKSKGFDDILQKPFNIADLRSVVQRNISI